MRRLHVLRGKVALDVVVFEFARLNELARPGACICLVVAHFIVLFLFGLMLVPINQIAV